VETVYLVGAGAEVGTVDGALEGRIVARLQGWEANPGAARWPLGPSIYELVYALYDANQTRPGKWLAAFAVDEAGERGLGRMVKGPNGEATQRPPQGLMERVARFVERMAGHFEVDPAAERLMEAQHAVVLDLIEQLEEADRDFVQHLRAEAGRAIAARENSSD
jgi:hypothetical protein